MHQFPPPPPQKSEREMNGYQPGDEFLIVVTHELRTPTAAILGWIELLDRTAIDSKMFAQGIEIIKRNAQLQSQLIDHLIDFSLISRDDFKLELQKIAIVPIVSAAIETMRPLALSKDIHITSRLDPVGVFIMGDSFRLQQVFTNLLSNAIKFTRNNSG